MTEIRPRRSVLSVPGSDPGLIEAARSLKSDAVLFDLEDTVAPGDKARARDAVAAAVSARHHGRREVAVRINTLDGPYGEDDLAALARARPDAILVPKVSAPDTLVAVGSRLRRLGVPPTLRVWAMIETPLAVLHVGEIASAARDVDTRLSCLVVAPGDLARAGRLRDGPGGPAVLPWLMACIAAARAYEIDAITGGFGSNDSAGFAAELGQARACGFDGMVIADADRIAAANEAFSSDAREIDAAREIVAAFTDPASHRDGAVSGGRTLARADFDEAQRTLALHAAIKAHSA